MNQRIDSNLVEELRALLGDRATISRGVREHHGKDESYYPYASPDAVVFPHTTEEVRDVVNICRRYRTPIVPYVWAPRSRATCWRFTAAYAWTCRR